MGDNTRQNQPARDAANAVGLNDAQRRKLHDLITGQNYSYQEILELARAIKAGQL